MEYVQEKNKVNVVLAAGATGGHVQPAVVIAQKLCDRQPSICCHFLGRKNSIEEETAREKGFVFHTIRAAMLPSLRDFDMFYWLRETISGIRTSKAILRELKPKLVIGTGGFVSAPVIWAARFLKIPYVLHEQNVVPGRTNRYFARKSECVCISEAESAKYFPRKVKTVLAGNPIDSLFFNLSKAEGREYIGFNPEQKLILVLGGSAGAKSINDAIMGLRGNEKWLELIAGHPEILLVLSVGRDQAKEDIAMLEGIPNVVVKDYIYDMPQWMAAADLVVSRAGAMTCAEIAALGKPALLVPYPYAANDHQRINAQHVAASGGADWCPDEEFTADYLLTKIRTAVVEPEKLQLMAENIKVLALPEASTLICEQIEHLLFE